MKCLQICCLLHTKYHEINPPFQIVNIPNGCEAYSPTILIPANTELLLTNSSLDLLQEFIDFNQTHISLSDFKVINDFKLAYLSGESITHLTTKLPDFDTEVNYEDIFYDLNSVKDIATHYPYSDLRTWQIVMITIISTIVFIIVSAVILTMCIYKRKYQ